MGEVFLATDTLLGRSVALKLLSSKLASEPMRKRFEREVAVSAALQSDHIVQVFDYGVTDEGYPFYVMEYLEGQTLGQMLKQRKRLSVAETVTLMTQVCAGLYLAHQGVNLQWQGASSSQYVKVVHRDLKPDNIFLVSTALGEFVKILDFGIAKIRSDQIEHTHVTDMFMGTYQYASPEQLRAEQDLDERADIYSLGMILYKMLTGSVPFDFLFEQKGDFQPSGAVWAVAHLTKPPIPLRQQPGYEHLPQELDAIVMQCLQKSPAQRFASVLELSQSLQRVAYLDRNFPDRNTLGPPDLAENKTETLHIPAPEADVTHLTTAEANSNLTALNPIEATELRPVTAITEACHPLKPLPSNPGSDSLPDSVSDPALNRSSRSLLHRSQPAWMGLGVSIVAVMVAATIAGIYSWRSSARLMDIATDIATNISGEPGSTSTDSESSTSPTSPESPSSTVQSDRLTQPLSAPTRSLLGHKDTVWNVAISPDGETLASASFDRTIRLWDLETGTVLQTLEGHRDAVRSLAISPDGQTLVSGSGDKTVKVWDLQTGELIRTIDGHAGPVWTVALSPEGETLVSGSYDGTIKTWDLPTGKLLQTIPEDYDSIWSVVISPDGQTLASGSYGSTIKLRDLQSGNILQTLSGHSDAVRSLAISPDGKTLVSGSWDKTVKVWDLQTGKLQQTLSGHADRVLAVAISPDGKTIASGSVDRTIKLWDLQTGERLQTLAGHSDWVISVTFSSDGKTIASGSKDRSIKVWQQ